MIDKDDNLQKYFYEIKIIIVNEEIDTKNDFSKR